MENSDFMAFVECMAGLQEVFTPDKPVSERKAEIYFEIFKGWDIQKFKEACSKITITKRISTFPLPAEIKEVLEGTIVDSSIEAFNVFIEGKARTGIYESVEFEDKTIHDVIVAFGGWESICLIPEDQWQFRRKEWLDLYRIMKNNPRRDTPRRLIGLIEAHNSQNPDWKIYTKLTIFIGDGKGIKQIE